MFALPSLIGAVQSADFSLTGCNLAAAAHVRLVRARQRRHPHARQGEDEAARQFPQPHGASSEGPSEALCAFAPRPSRRCHLIGLGAPCFGLFWSCSTRRHRCWEDQGFCTCWKRVSCASFFYCTYWDRLRFFAGMRRRGLWDDEWGSRSMQAYISAHTYIHTHTPYIHTYGINESIIPFCSNSTAWVSSW